MTFGGLIRRVWPKWVLVFAFWTVLGLAFGGQLYLSRSKIGDPVSWSFALQRSLADWYVFALLSLPVLGLARRFQFDAANWSRALPLHLVSGAAFSFAWMAVRALLEQWQTRGELQPVPFSAAFDRALVATFFFNLLIYSGIVIVQHAFGYYSKFNERQLHAAALEVRLAEARLQALQMQLNPHFLFNTLNAITSLMHRDVEAADRMIALLSDLLRYTLESTGVHEVPLRQELEFLDRYLEIQQARFGERLTVRREVDAATLDALVPNLVLQPLVENALQHGIAPHARPGLLVLRAAQRDGQLELEVRDNGEGLHDGPRLREGVGVANTRARLRELYGAAQSMELINAPEGGLLARVTLPFHSTSTANGNGASARPRKGELA